MLVQIKNGENSSNEWVLLEFQGELVGDLEDTEMGTITISDNKAQMFIGNHLLEGSLIVLKNPFLIIEKDGKNSEVDNNNSEIGKEVQMLGLVKKKILFSGRPKPRGQL